MLCCTAESVYYVNATLKRCLQVGCKADHGVEEKGKKMPIS